ncbi:MAG: ATP-binding protein [Planctomycetota bacterium]
MSTNAAKDRSAADRLDQAYLLSLFHGAGFGIVACESDGRVVACNVQASKLLPGAEATESPISVTDLFPPCDRETIRKLLSTCLSTLEPAEFNTRLDVGDPEPRDYAVWITPVLAPAGELRGVSFWLRDITKRQRLQHIVEKGARMASLGKLAGAVAHHYSNLLCSIGTSVEYARHMSTMTAMRRSLQRTSKAVGRAADITRQLLAFAQADHRDENMADLTETVLYFFDQREARLESHRIKLELDWQKIPALPIPREHFQIVLENLTNNAIDVMPDGGTLRVRLARHDHDTVQLSIADTGAGLSVEDLEHLFEPFHTSKGVLASGDTDNTGLGLAVAHGLVREMHGTITAGNIPGSGAHFDIVLPIPKES